MKIETPFIALLLSSLFFTVIFTMFLSMADDYSVSYDLTPYQTEYNNTDLASAFNKINQTKNEIDSTTSTFSSQEVGDSGDVFEFFKMTYQLGKQVFSSLSILKTVMMILGEIIGVPTYVIVVLFSILMVTFAISVIMIMMGRSYE